VKSKVSIFGCVALVSVSVFSIILAYKLGKEQCRTDTSDNFSQLKNKMIALKEGQTIVGVSDRTKAMRFYISNDVVES
jgi:hypothetical protein